MRNKRLQLYGRGNESHVIFSGSDYHVVNNKSGSPVLGKGS